MFGDADAHRAAQPNSQELMAFEANQVRRFSGLPNSPAK
jgi:hypothetical protein